MVLLQHPSKQREGYNYAFNRLFGPGQNSPPIFSIPPTVTLNRGDLLRDLDNMVRPMSYSSQPSHSATSSIASSTASSSVFFLPQYMNVPEPEYISLAGAISTVENYLPPENVIARGRNYHPCWITYGQFISRLYPS